MTKTKKNASVQSNPDLYRFYWLKWGGSSLVLVIIFLLYRSWRSPISLDWGFHHLFYYPGWLGLLTGIGCLVLVTYLWFYPQFVEGLGRILDRSKKDLPWYWFGGVLLIFISFWIFYQYYPIWGDGIRILIPIRNLHTENKIGFIYLYHYLLQWFTSIFPTAGESALFYWTSPLWGLIYLVFLSMMVDQIGRNRLEKLLFLGVGITMGTIQYFYGYMEAYGLPLALQPLFLYWVIRHLKNYRWFDLFAAMMVFALMAYIHQMCMVLVVPMLYVWFLVIWRIPSRRWRGVILYGTIATVFFSGLYGVKFLLIDWGWLYLYSKMFQQFSLLPLLWDWFWQTFNFLILGSATALAFPVILLYAVITSAGRRIIWNDPWQIFIAAAGAISLCFMLLPNLVYGPMDWDAGCALCLFPGLATVSFVLDSHWKKRRSLVLGLIFLSGMNTIAFIGLNHSPDMSLQRYLDIVEINRVTNQRSFVGSAFNDRNNNPYLHAQMIFSDLGLDSLAESMARKSVEYSQSDLEQAQMISNIALQNLFQGDFQQARRFSIQAVEKSPIYIPGRINLMKSYLALEMLDSARIQSETIDSLFKCEVFRQKWGSLFMPEFYLALLNLRIQQKQYQSALPIIRKLDQIMEHYNFNDRRDKQMNLLYDKCIVYYNLHDYSPSLRAVEAFLEYQPEHPFILRLQKELRNRINP